MRKVPENLPNQDMLAEHLQQPLTAVPDPFGTHDSFAAHNNARLQAFLDQFGFEYEFISATEFYRSGRFDEILLRAAERYDRIMEVIESIINIGPERFHDFCNSVLNSVTENIKILKVFDGENATAVNTIYRNLHTIKGSARTYGFSKLSAMVHNVESTYSRLKEKKEIFELKEFEKDQKHIAGIIDTYIDIFNDKLRVFEKSRKSQIAVSDHVLNLRLNEEQERRQISGYLHEQYYLMISDDLEEIVSALRRSAAELAESMNKGPPELLVSSDNDIRFNKKFSRAMQDVLSHCIRNSVDHGIEDGEERAEKGKSKTGWKVLLFKKFSY